MHRYANDRDTAAYVNLVEKLGSAEDFREVTNLASEFVFLGLRKTEGVDLADYRRRFGIDILQKYASDLEGLQEAELVKISGGNLRLTRKGILYSNEVFRVFV